MTLREMIEVLEAAERKEPLQALDTFYPSSGWFDIDPPLGPPVWNFARYAIRIKPREPRVRYAVGYPDGSMTNRVWESRELAEHHVSASINPGASVVEFKEVM